MGACAASAPGGLLTTMKSPTRSFSSDFKVFFLRGLAILLPSVLTIWIVVYAYQFVSTRIAEPINSVTRLAIIKTTPLIIRGPGDDPAWAAAHYPAWYHVTVEEVQAEIDRRNVQKLPRLEGEALKAEVRRNDLKTWWDQHIWLNAIGLIVAVLLFYLAGRVLGGFVGRRIAARLERIVSSVPIFKQVYPYVKQLVDFMLGETKVEFNRVVIVEYPRKGIWSLGFLTGPAMIDMAPMAQAQPGELVTVFIPSSPTPFTGYTITLPRSEICELNITVEEALRFTVSGGVLIPDRQALAVAQAAPAKRSAGPAKAPVQTPDQGSPA